LHTIYITNFAIINLSLYKALVPLHTISSTHSSQHQNHLLPFILYFEEVELDGELDGEPEAVGFLLYLHQRLLLYFINLSLVNALCKLVRFPENLGSLFLLIVIDKRYAILDGLLAAKIDDLAGVHQSMT